MKTLIRDARIVNEGEIYTGSVLIDGEYIQTIFRSPIPEGLDLQQAKIIDAGGQYLIPGVIDDQVHFREPGLTHKGDIASESLAAVAGGVTSFMEMPNTHPQTTTRELLEMKYQRASEVSLANYSFYMGTTNDNLAEVIKINPRNVCGIKIFMGASTGNMLVDNEETLAEIFRQAPTLVATHCEDEATIRAASVAARKTYGDAVPFAMHPVIRSAEACLRSSGKAVELASKYNTRLHVLHLSTAAEMALFASGPVSEKMITSEVCVHHLWFNEHDYATKGALIKWNPAIKSEADRLALWEALLSGKIDVVATDHAPHTLEEKGDPYFNAPSGGPLVQHSIIAMLEMSRKGLISPEMIVTKMCHAPAELFKIEKRGFIREGYYADLVLVKPDDPWTVTRENVLYKCGWSPFEGQSFSHRLTHTFVNGQPAYHNGVINHGCRGKRLLFNR